MKWNDDDDDVSMDVGEHAMPRVYPSEASSEREKEIDRYKTSHPNRWTCLPPSRVRTNGPQLFSIDCPPRPPSHNEIRKIHHFDFDFRTQLTEKKKLKHQASYRLNDYIQRKVDEDDIYDKKSSSRRPLSSFLSTISSSKEIHPTLKNSAHLLSSLTMPLLFCQSL